MHEEIAPPIIALQQNKGSGKGEPWGALLLASVPSYRGAGVGTPTPGIFSQQAFPLL
jgi:hypothetical protein